MEPKRNIVFCGVLTISDRCAAGITEDLSGPNLQKVLQEYPKFKSVVKMRKIVADEIAAIKDTLIDWSDKEKLNLILTTGGTGISPRDITPEATAQVLEKELHAITIGIVAASLEKTRFSMLTRMKCGTRGKTLILNLPGSKRVAEECLRFVLPVLGHANDVLSNNLDEVDSFHRAADSCLEKNQVTTSSATTQSRVLVRPESPPPNSQVVSQHSHVIPGVHTVIPDSHVIPSVGHVISPDSHTIPVSSHAISPNSHVVSYGSHAVSRDSHTIPPNGHVISPDSHTVSYDNHIISPDSHVISPNSHAIPPDAHSINRDLHTISADSHPILLSQGMDLSSDDIERELRDSGLLETNAGVSAEMRTLPPEPVLLQSKKLPAPYSTALNQITASLVSAEKRKAEKVYYLPIKVAKRARESPYPLIPVDKAKATVLENAYKLPVISVSYEDALGYVLAEAITAPMPVPHFQASIKDGYAVIAADTPGELKVIGSSIYGVTGPDSILRSGETIRITTGSPVPAGADAIVQVEDTKLLEDAKGGEIEVRIAVTTKVKEGQDIRAIGSDIQQGECVLRPGTCLGPSEIGILATLGITKVKVYRKPVVAVLSTGNEIAEPNSSLLEVGQVRDSNRKMLLSYLKQAGFETVDIGIVVDDANKIKLSLETAFNKADVVVTSGGVSIGEKDFLKYTIKCIGGTVHFGRVLMKPGKPTTFGTVNTEKGKKLIFALPGNPVSTAVTFNLFTLPALRRMSGFLNPNAIQIKAKTRSEIALDPRPEFKRCSLTWNGSDSTPYVETTGNQISSRLASMVNANALISLPSKSETCKEIKKEELVDVLIIDKL